MNGFKERIVSTNLDGITVKRRESVSPIIKGVPGPMEVARALSRLAILPNPNDPTLDNPADYVESPWAVVPVPTIDPVVWDSAAIEIVSLGDLLATDPFLGRKRVAKHIEAMGQAMTPYRSLALILDTGAELIIIDGHHRLMAWWLLGQEEAPVWRTNAR